MKRNAVGNALAQMPLEHLLAAFELNDAVVKSAPFGEAFDFAHVNIAIMEELQRRSPAAYARWMANSGMESLREYFLD